MAKFLTDSYSSETYSLNLQSKYLSQTTFTTSLDPDHKA